VSERKGRLSDAADAVRLQHALVGHAAPPAHASATASTAAAGAPTTVTIIIIIIIDSTPPPVARARGLRRHAVRRCLVGALDGDFPAARPAVVPASQPSPGTTATAARRYAADDDVARERVLSRRERRQ